MLSRLKNTSMLERYLLLCFAAVIIAYFTRAFIPEFVANAIRESQSASVTRYFYHHGLSDFFRPIFDVMYPGPGYLLIEIPHVQALWSIAYHVFGFDVLWPKLMSASAFILCLLCYALTLKRLDFPSQIIWLSTFFLAIAPLNLNYQVALMIDPYALSAAMAALYFCVRFSQSRRWRDLLMLCACIMLAASIKIFTAIPIFAALMTYIIYDYWVGGNQTRNRHLGLFATILTFGIAAAMLVAWFFWSEHVHLESTSFMNAETTSGVMQRNFLGSWQARFQPYFWETWARTLFFFWPVDLAIVQHKVTRIGLLGMQAVILLAGVFYLALSLRLRQSVVLIGWTLGYLASAMIFFNAFTTHNYYNLSIQPIFALLFGCGLYAIFLGVNRFIVPRLRWSFLHLVLVLAALLFAAVFLRWLWPQYAPWGQDFAWYGNQFAITGVVLGVAMLALLRSPMLRPVDRMVALAAFIILAGGLSGFDRRSVERFWEIQGPSAWIITPGFIQQMAFIEAQTSPETPVVIVSHRGFIIPESLYKANRKGQMVGFPSSQPMYGIPMTASPKDCLLADKLPMRLDPICLNWLRGKGFKDYFVIYVSPNDDMPEPLLKEKMKALGLSLLTRYTAPVDEKAVVLHYRDKYNHLNQ